MFLFSHTKTVDSVFRALLLATQTRDVQRFSPPSDAKLVQVTSKMAYRSFVKFLRLLRRKEGDEIWFLSFYR